MGPYLHPIASPQPELASLSLAQPADCREHVHVFFVNGLDPLNKDNFRGLCDYVQQLGFTKTYHKQLYEAGQLTSTIRHIRETDPAARFVLVGFSFGTNAVQAVTNDLAGEGVSIDLLVYLGGDTLTNDPEACPANARRVVNITARGCVWLAGGLVWDGVDLDGAVNLRLDAGHADVPSHPQTLELLARQLADVAAGQ